MKGQTLRVLHLSAGVNGRKRDAERLEWHSTQSVERVAHECAWNAEREQTDGKHNLHPPVSTY